MKRNYTGHRVGRWATLAVLGGAIALGAAADTLVVKTSEVTLRKVPSSIGEKVVVAPRNAALTVVRRQGKYSLVKFGDSEGWVYEPHLTKQRFVVPQSGSVALSQGTQAGRAQEAASTKGLEPLAKSYADSNNINVDAFVNLVRQRQEIIDSGAVAAFAAEGKVGRR